MRSNKILAIRVTTYPLDGGKPISDRVETLNIHCLAQAFAYLIDKSCIIRIEHQGQSLISVDGKCTIPEPEPKPQPQIEPEPQPRIDIVNGRIIRRRRRTVGVDLRKREYAHLRKPK